MTKRRSKSTGRATPGAEPGSRDGREGRFLRSAQPKDSFGPEPSGSRVSSEMLSTETLPSLPSNAVLTVAEAARFLRVNRNTLYDAVKRGEVPGVIKVGRVLRISRAALIVWMREGRVPR